jgi:hypothetical protein
MASKSVIFEYQLKHKLKIQVNGGAVIFNEKEQEIYLTGLKVQPAMDLQKIEVKAHYPAGTAKQIAEAVSKILNIHAKPAPTRETVRGEKTLVNASEISKKAAAKTPDAEKGEAIKESALPDMYVDVVSDMLNISGNYDVDGSQFSVSTSSEDMMKIITFRKSKYVKIFINGKEFKPQDEVEFVRRVFPQIDMTVYLK